MFADGHLLTQLIHIFLLLKIKRCFENLVILLTWIRPGLGSGSGLIKFCGAGSRSGYDQSESTSLLGGGGITDRWIEFVCFDLPQLEN